jgi:hypothetical protein
LDIDEERKYILAEEEIFFLLGWFIKTLYYVMVSWDSSD